MNRKVVISNDGSSTIFWKEMDEHYHSIHGAIQESRHVFIDAGLKFFSKKKIDILEIGFGTGLNALLSYLEAKSINLNIHFSSIELYPLSLDKIELLNYADIMLTDKVDCKKILKKLHCVSWNREVVIDNCFSLKKMQMDIVDFDKKNEYDLIYFDAFAPSSQPELWTREVFLSMFNALKEKGGVLVTYCAKGQVKRDLKSVGFQVNTLQGPPGKREMIQAVKFNRDV